MIRRGELYYADLSNGIGSEQGGIRPVLILQNDLGNIYSNTTIVAAITATLYQKAIMPTHVMIGAREGLKSNSIVLLEQIRTIDKSRIKKKIGDLSINEMLVINRCLEISIGLTG